MMRATAPILLLVLALAAVAVPAAADGADLRAASVSVEGEAFERGELAMLYLHEGGGATHATPWVALEADRLHAVSYTSTYEEVSLPSGVPVLSDLTTPTRPQEPRESRAEAASGRLSAAQNGFELHVLPTASLLEYEASSRDFDVEPAQVVRMGQAYFGPGTPSSTGPNGLDGDNFANVERQGPLTIHRGPAPHAELTLRGDFVLELFGLTLDVSSPEGSFTLASGSWEQAMAEGLPPEPASKVRITFVRLFVEGGELTVAVDGGEPTLQWAAAGQSIEPQGDVTFHHAYGLLGDRVLQDDRYVLPAGKLVRIAPQMEGLDIDISAAGAGPRSAVAQLPAETSAALVGGGAVLALVAAVAIGAGRRWLRAPVLADVEAAIEEGSFHRAARQAARILARRPADESALLARSIALTKGGRPEVAVREIGIHLARHPASDGSLHYVLGLAQLDLGRGDEGRAALREAVRLTPSLQAEVAPRLGKAFSTPSPTLKEATAYA